MTITCGEATIRLLAKYGIDVVFGIPGVHTLEFCAALGEDGPIQHIQVRNEQGAGFMAEGYARATGKPAVALVISGPGVTNAATAIGQAWADSLPVILLSAEAASDTIGKGWGVLHEVTEQKAVTEPLTALSATAHKPEDVPELLAQAFSISLLPAHALSTFRCPSMFRQCQPMATGNPSNCHPVHTLILPL